MAECCKHQSHSEANGEQFGDHGTIVLDPVCGMKVDTRTAQHRYELRATPYYFCSVRCLDKFRADPDRYLNPPEHDPALQTPNLGLATKGAQGTTWTCPMHPEIRRDGPGTCPICGMAPGAARAEAR